MIKRFAPFKQIVNFNGYHTFCVLNLLMYVKTKQRLQPGFVSLQPVKRG